MTIVNNQGNAYKARQVQRFQEQQVNNMLKNATLDKLNAK